MTTESATRKATLITAADCPICGVVADHLAGRGYELNICDVTDAQEGGADLREILEEHRPALPVDEITYVLAEQDGALPVVVVDGIAWGGRNVMSGRFEDGGEDLA